MRILTIVVFGLFCAAPALAESPNLEGMWVGETTECPSVNLNIKSQSEKGAVEGTIACAKTGITESFGEKLIPGKQMGGSFDGTVLVLDGMASTTRVTLQGGKLVGYIARPKLPRTPLTLVRK